MKFHVKFHVKLTCLGDRKLARLTSLRQVEIQAVKYTESIKRFSPRNRSYRAMVREFLIILTDIRDAKVDIRLAAEGKDNETKYKITLTSPIKKIYC